MTETSANDIGLGHDEFGKAPEDAIPLNATADRTDIDTPQAISGCVEVEEDKVAPEGKGQDDKELMPKKPTLEEGTGGSPASDGPPKKNGFKKGLKILIYDLKTKFVRIGKVKPAKDALGPTGPTIIIDGDNTTSTNGTAPPGPNSGPNGAQGGTPLAQDQTDNDKKAKRTRAIGCGLLVLLIHVLNSAFGLDVDIEDWVDQMDF